MQWTSEGIILFTRPLGEKSHLASLLTPDCGRHMGVLRGAPPMIGTVCHYRWSARLPHDLGNWQLDPLMSVGARIMSDPHKLQALLSLCHLTHHHLAERHPYPILYATLLQVLSSLLEEDEGTWKRSILTYYLCVLTELGFGLDLSQCAATGSKEDLIYISPKTGRAVSASAGAPYAHKLFPLLPVFLDPSAPCTSEELDRAFDIVQYFLKKRVQET